MPAEYIKIDTSDDIMIVTLDRPQKRNALNRRMIESLFEIFSNPPKTAKAAVLCGSSPHFCAGMDLAELDPESDALHEIRHSMLWYKAFEAIEFGQLPVVAVLQGGIIGGGLELACAAHIRVAEESTMYSLPEGQRGIFVGGGASSRVPGLIGTARTSDMLLTGRKYDALEGERIGFSQYVVPNGQGRDKALGLARQIASNAPLTNFAVVQALPRIAGVSREQGLLTEALMSAITKSDKAAKERVAAFLTKPKAPE